MHRHRAPTSADAAQTLSRRRFLTLASLLPMIPALPVVLRAAASDSASGAAASGAPVPIGLELYSVRDELARDLPGTLRRVRAAGYQTVEFYAPYFDWIPAKAKEVRTILDDVGLRCPSTHNHIGAFAGDGLAKAAELNGILGSHLVVLAAPPQTDGGLDTWEALAATLSSASEQLGRHGLAAGYHNHGWEWKRLPDGRRIMDVLAANTPKAFTLQFDIGTCVEAGQDPVAWIRANPGRIRSMHLKDWAPGTKEDEKEYRVLFGEGVAPWREICAAAESVGGIQSYLLEQEGSRFSEFETMERCLQNWSAFRRA